MSILFFILAVICYTISEGLQHGKYLSSQKFWSSSGVRKYKYINGAIQEPPKNWYYRFFKLKYKERFPGSATILVSLTDGYHLTQFGFKVFLCASIAFYSPILGHWDALGYFVLFGVVFTVIYRLLSK